MSTVDKSFDVAVIGAGTAGYSASLRASELGLSVALIEMAELGGTCIHRGCIPTKVMLYAAELMEDAAHAELFGVHAASVSLEWSALLAAKQMVVDKLRKGIALLLSERGVARVQGKAAVRRPGLVSVEGEGGAQQIEARHIVIATGSAPRLVGGLEPDGTRVLTSDEALKLESLPESVVILGAGAVGIEFASLFRSFGSKVDVIELAPRILPAEDADASAQLSRALVARGVGLQTSTSLESADSAGDGIIVKVSRDGEGASLEAECLLVAVGRRPISENIGLEGLAVLDERGFVKVDALCRTEVEGLYAVGDVIPTPQLAHAAFAEGIAVAEVIGGLEPEPVNYDRVPSCVYSHPELARVGLTETEAVERGFAVETVKLPFRANSKASVMLEDAGFAKLVGKKDGPLLGVHMVGPHVSELISEAMLVTGWEATPAELAQLIHPHPTLSEIIGEGALKMAGKPLHTL